MEAVRGSAEELYALLALYSHVLQSTNPGTVTHLQTNEASQFLYYFFGNRLAYSWVFIINETCDSS